jgi:hypothetical protein
MPQRHNGGAEVQLHSFLTLATKWRRVVNSTPQPREESLYPLNKKLGGPTACLDISEKKKSHVSTGVLNLYLAACSSHNSSLFHSDRSAKTSNQHTLLQSPVCIMYCT